MNKRFRDRTEAGQQLAQKVAACRLVDPVIIALPRGGVPVAAEVARTLHAPLDLVIVRKLGAPGNPELAVAAVSEGGESQVVVDEAVRASVGVSRLAIKEQARNEMGEIERRLQRYVGGAARIPLKGRTAVLVDDGVATGTSVRAAAVVLRARGARELVLAVPVAPAEVIAELEPLFERIVCLRTPDPYYAVGYHYEDFHQVGDEEVVAALKSARDAQGPAAAARAPDAAAVEGNK